MRSKNNAPTAAQKKWRSKVADLGCVVCGSTQVQIHHVLGATAKHNKIHIGEWFILPLHPINHSYIDQGIKGLNSLKSDAISRYDEETLVDPMSLHDFEKYLFGKVLRKLQDRPFGQDVINAISEWSR